jgi:hypothetical protein
VEHGDAPARRIFAAIDWTFADNRPAAVCARSKAPRFATSPDGEARLESPTFDQKAAGQHPDEAPVGYRPYAIASHWMDISGRTRVFCLA